MNYSGLTIILAVIMLAVVYTFVKSLSRHDNVGRHISILLFFAVIDSAGYLVEIISKSPLVCTWAASVQYIFTMWIMVMLFTIKYGMDVHRIDIVGRIGRLFIYAFSVVATCLMLMNPFINFMFRYVPVQWQDITVLGIIYETNFFTMYIAWLIVMILYTLISILAHFKKSSIVYREKYVMIAIAMVAPSVTEAVYQFSGAVGANYDSMVIGICSILLYVTFGKVGRYLSRIYSRNFMIDDIGSMVVLFDDTGRLADYSEKAGETLNFTEDYLQIMDEAMFVDGRLNLEPDYLTDGASVELPLNVRDERHYYNLDFRELRDSRDYVIGHMYIFHDITALRDIYNEFENELTKDPVTGLYSERVLNIRMREMDVNDNLPLCIAVMDINGLGMVNDMFGMDEGDRMIKFCNEVLHTQLRVEDFVATVDCETVIIMPCMTEEHAVAKMNLVKKLIGYQVDFPIPVSVEFGVAEKRDNMVLIEDVLKEARASMRCKKLLVPESSRAFVVNTLTAYADKLGINSPERRARVRNDVREIAWRLGLSDEMRARAELTAMLQGIGMITVSDRIISKKGKLTDDEWADVRLHPLKGYYILNSNPELEGVASYVLAQNERWDGTGYPNGLKGEEIPLLARIVTVADTFEVMTHDTSYRKAKSKEEAMEELVKCSGTQFDENIVNIYLEILRKRDATDELETTVQE